MEAERIKQYERIKRHLEEPIREIVPALWHLPFVIDTGYTCSGHVIVEKEWGMRGDDYLPDKKYVWYQREPRLEFAFSVDPAMAESRDNFRRDLSSVGFEANGLGISFDKISSYPKDYLPYSCKHQANLSENYKASIPENRSEELVIYVESLMANFWEQVADVVRKHNPEAKIGAIQGKSFRRRSNWDHWGLTFLKGEKL